MHPDDTLPCFRASMGLWAIEKTWARKALEDIQRGLWPVRTPEMLAAEMRRDTGKLYSTTADGAVAIIRIQDQLTKGLSKFGGTSTILTKRALREAVKDEGVQSILLAIDSPGGSVDGIQDLADTITEARTTKTVDAYIEDLGASAAYWLASQARRITANATAFIGSIGVFAVLEDLSGLAEREGVKVRVISTGKYKGAGAPGTPVSDAVMDEAQKHVDQIGAFFFAAVKGGRRMNAPQLAAVTDGRLWIAREAQQLGLIDAVETFEKAAALSLEKRPVRHTAARAELGRLKAALGIGGENSTWR